MARKDYVGTRFGRLLVIEEAKPKYWKCLCDCGELRVVHISPLTSGRQVSCGCYHREMLSKMNRSPHPRILHGHTRNKKISVEYRTWKNMKARCYNAKSKGFQRYGGRGIYVCDRWKTSFESFLQDMGPKPSPELTIERINNDGNYEPSNCKWATRSEQQKNQAFNAGRFIPGHK